MKTVYSCVIAGYDIILKQRNSFTFSVEYGEEITDNLNYAQAAKVLGECIMHALCNEGKID